MRLYFFIILGLCMLCACSKVEPENNNPGVIVLDGDSRTDGWNCSYRYPYIDLLSIDDSCVIIKTSEGGNTTDSLLSRAADRVDPLFIDSAKFNIVVVWCGVNDIAVQKKSKAEVFANLKKYCQYRRLAGWKVIICTEVSIKGHGFWGDFDQVRERMNDMIRMRWPGFCDGLADLARNPKIGAKGAYLDTLYFCDGKHLTNIGTQAVAAIINKSIIDLID